MAEPTANLDIRWYQRAGAWFGSGINPATISIGGGLATRIPLGAVLLLFPLGLAVLFAITVAQGLVGRQRRHPLALRTEDTFGNGRTTTFFTVVIAFALAGWLAFFVGLGGFTLADLLGIPDAAGALVIALITIVLSQFGVNRWSMLVWVTAAASLLLAFVTVAVVEARPQFDAQSWQFTASDVIWVVGTVVAFAITHGVRCPDFTWDMRSDRDVWTVGVLWAVPFWIATTIGAVLYQATGDWNIAELLANRDQAVLGQIFLLIAIGAPMLGATYSGSLAVARLSGFSVRHSTWLICGVAFLLGVTRFDQQLLPFLDVLGVVLPAALIVMLGSAWIRPKLPFRVATGAWITGAFVGLVFYLQGNVVHTLASMLTTVVLLVAARQQVRKTA